MPTPITEINRYVDHTLLKADAKPEDIMLLCQEASKCEFFSVCVNGSYARHARQTLDALYTAKDNAGHRVKVCCVVGFPLGAMIDDVKAMEAKACIESGAEEIDTVINVGKMKAGDTDAVLQDVKKVVSVCKERNVICKVILETALLTTDEIKVASEIALSAGADFIKTSTGFSTRGATIGDMEIMSPLAIKYNAKVKASGGVRSLADAQAMIQAGASRLGTSSGVKIMQGLESDSSTY